MPTTTPEPSGATLLDLRTSRGRLTLATVTLGSGIALLDGTVVNIALRQIGVELDASLGQLQWVVNGYALSLAALILVGGALGDRLGRKRLYLTGVLGFALGSALCAFAQDPLQLVAFRVLQGVAGALLAPGALAIIQASFRKEDRPSAIGTWAGMSGIAAALGPFVGGFLLDHGGWRWIFAINLPLCALVLLLGSRIPESRDEAAPRHFDWMGALTRHRGPGYVDVRAHLVARDARSPGVADRGPRGREHRAVRVDRGPPERDDPRGAVALTRVLGGEPDDAADLRGPRDGAVLPGADAPGHVRLLGDPGGTGHAADHAVHAAALGAVLAPVGTHRPAAPDDGRAAGVCDGAALLSGVGEDASYWTDVFPGLTIFALGLAMLVSPLTVAVLAAAPSRHAGIASGVNNAVARTGSLLAVAALPAVVGLSGDDYRDPAMLQTGYHQAMLIAAAMLAAGGVVSWFGLHGVGRAGYDDDATRETQESS